MLFGICICNRQHMQWRNLIEYTVLLRENTGRREVGRTKPEGRSLKMINPIKSF
jgi:hypothetical protein